MDPMTDLQTIVKSRQARAARKRAARTLAGRLSVGLALALATAPAAHAIASNPGVLARATVSPSFFCADPGCGPVDNIVEGPSGHQHAEGSAIGGFGGAGSAMADVDFGQMHLFGEFTNSGNAAGFGQNEDMLTFTAPGVATGAFIDVTYAIFVDGVIEGAAGGAQGRWGLQADLGGGFFDINASATNDVANGYVGDPFGLYTATVTLQAGFAAPLDIELRAGGVSVTDSSAFGDLSHSLYWGGITNVAVGGVALNDFAVTSASGTDWSRSFVPGPDGSVPEPAAWMLMLTGFAGLGSIFRVRRKAEDASVA